MRTLAPIRVRQEFPGSSRPWWIVTCRTCGVVDLDLFEWSDAMQMGLGHLSLKHPQWPSSGWTEYVESVDTRANRAAFLSLDLDNDNHGE